MSNDDYILDNAKIDKAIDAIEATIEALRTVEDSLDDVIDRCDIVLAKLANRKRLPEDLEKDGTSLIDSGIELIAASGKPKMILVTTLRVLANKIEEEE